MKLESQGGQKTALWGSKKCIIVFAGQYYDAETGLHYNYFRYYDPTLGRYLRADPVGFEGGINLYAYVQNNPINWIDPYGLSAMAWAVPVAGGLALVDSPVLPFGDAVGGALIGIAWLIDNMPDDDEIEEIQQEMGLGGSSNPCPNGDDDNNKKKKLRKKPGKRGQFKGRDALRKENKMPRDAAREVGLTRDQQSQLHDAITGQDLKYQEIVDIARAIKNGTY